jgi:hypothetical protein
VIDSFDVDRNNPGFDGRKASTTSGTLTVGDGRGFVFLHKRRGIEQRLVITAAHCLPEEPVAASFWDHTYASLLGPLNQNPTVRADCLFCDRIADIAVLGPPDDQKYFDESMAYDALLDSVSLFSVSRAPREGPARLYSFDGRWFPCTVKQWRDGSLDIFEAGEGIKGGMSGSPIVVDDGLAIGVVCCSQGGSDEDDDRGGGPNPALDSRLPGWLLSGLFRRRRP